MKNSSMSKSYWDKRQVNKLLVGKIVDLKIYESKADKNLNASFLIIYSDDISSFGLCIKKFDYKNGVEFPIFNGEFMEHDEKFHKQIFLNFKSQNISQSVRILDIAAINGIGDIDLQNIHIFKTNTPFTNVREIDANSFEDIMIAFFKNPVTDLSSEQTVHDIYNQYIGFTK